MPGRYFGELEEECNEYGWPYECEDFDRELKDLITELIKAGYSTETSCAGHPGSELFGRGFVRITPEFSSAEAAEVKSIARKLGFRRVEARNDKVAGHGILSFKAVGRPR